MSEYYGKALAANQQAAASNSPHPARLNDQLSNAITRVSTLVATLRGCGDDLSGCRPEVVSKDVSPTSQNLQSMMIDLHQSITNAENEAARIRQAI